jgi:hypothetical protein
MLAWKPRSTESLKNDNTDILLDKTPEQELGESLSLSKWFTEIFIGMLCLLFMVLIGIILILVAPPAY